MKTERARKREKTKKDTSTCRDRFIAFYRNEIEEDIGELKPRIEKIEMIILKKEERYNATSITLDFTSRRVYYFN